MIAICKYSNHPSPQLDGLLCCKRVNLILLCELLIVDEVKAFYHASAATCSSNLV